MVKSIIFKKILYYGLLGGASTLACTTAAHYISVKSKDATKYPARGKIVKTKIGDTHYISTNSNSQMPTVVFIGDYGETTDVFENLLSKISSTINTLSYDRAGYGFSEKCRDYIPRHISNLTIELHLLLQQTDLPKPYILVGHGLGTMIARMYLAKFGDDVKSVVLLDPIYERSITESDWMNKHSRKKYGALVKAYLARHGIMEWIVNLPFTTKAILNNYPIEGRAPLRHQYTKTEFWKTLYRERKSIVESAKQIANTVAVTAEKNVPVTIFYSKDVKHTRADFRKLTRSPQNKIITLSDCNTYSILGSDTVAQEILNLADKNTK